MCNPEAQAPSPAIVHLESVIGLQAKAPALRSIRTVCGVRRVRLRTECTGARGLVRSAWAEHTLPKCHVRVRRVSGEREA